MVSNPNNAYVRPYAGELANRVMEPRRFMQALAGARQVGKTTLATQTFGCEGYIQWEVRAVRAPLPEYAISRIRTGQWIRGEARFRRRRLSPAIMKTFAPQLSQGLGTGPLHASMQQ